VERCIYSLASSSKTISIFDIKMDIKTGVLFEDEKLINRILHGN